MFLNNTFNYITGLYIFIHVKMSKGKDLKITPKSESSATEQQTSIPCMHAYPE